MLSTLTKAIIAAVVIGASASAAAQTAVMIVRHDVADFSSWKKVFDSDKPRRDKAGIIDKYVLRDTEKPNFITVVHEAASVEKIKAFMGDPTLKEKMGQAGVMGPPDIKIGTNTMTVSKQGPKK